MFPLAHYKTVVNIQRFCLFVCLCLFVRVIKSVKYSKVFVSPSPKSGEYSKVFALLTKKWWIFKCFCKPITTKWWIFEGFVCLCVWVVGFFYTKAVNIRRSSLTHYQKVINILRLSVSLQKSGEYSNVSASPLQTSGGYSKVFAFPLQKSNEYSKVFSSLFQRVMNIQSFSLVHYQKGDEYSKVFCLSSGLLGPFGPHQARARGSSCGLLRPSGLSQASGTPMRMLAGARTALQT